MPAEERSRTMTNFEKITRSPEALAEFLRNLVAVNTPWEKEFSRLICASCGKECCDGCSSIQMSKDPLWWLGMQAEEPEAEGDEDGQE